jgi:hypothetical protein
MYESYRLTRKPLEASSQILNTSGSVNSVNTTLESLIEHRDASELDTCSSGFLLNRYFSFRLVGKFYPKAMDFMQMR